jgi:hypothetical protein
MLKQDRMESATNSAGAAATRVLLRWAIVSPAKVYNSPPCQRGGSSLPRVERRKLPAKLDDLLTRVRGTSADFVAALNVGSIPAGDVYLIKTEIKQKVRIESEHGNDVRFARCREVVVEGSWC